jgi:hypothetical protein
MLSIILVNYNNTALTINCINEILEQNLSEYEIIIIDNVSNNQDRRKIVEFFKEMRNLGNKNIRLILNSRNSGFSGGNNLGYKYCKGDIILLLNSDVHLGRDSIKKCYDMLKKHDKIDALGPKLMVYPEIKRIWSTGGFFKLYTPYIVKNRGFGEIDKDKYNKPEYVDHITGAAFFIKKQVIEKIGFLDDDFFLYWEETDLCIRMKRNKFHILYYPHAIIFHMVNLKKPYKLNYYVFMIKNRMTSIVKNFRLIHLIPQILLTPIFILTSIMVFYHNRLKCHPFDFIKAAINGFNKGIIKRLNLSEKNLL